MGECFQLQEGGRKRAERLGKSNMPCFRGAETTFSAAEGSRNR
jgi:hypothetical protein